MKNHQPKPKETKGPSRGRDPANQKYLRKATDMALEHLEQMSDEETKRLLGHSKAEVRKKWAERYRKMFADAKKSGEEGKRAKHKLDATLKSLGLRVGSDRLQQSKGESDDFHGYSKGGSSEPPPQYRDLFRAFKHGRSE